METAHNKPHFIGQNVAVNPDTMCQKHGHYCCQAKHVLSPQAQKLDAIKRYSQKYFGLLAVLKNRTSTERHTKAAELNGG
jgi:hypothetical protein